MNRFLEFLVVGVVMGVVEDLLAINFATETTISLNVMLVVFAVAVPFAIFSELIVDWRHFKKIRDLKMQLEALSKK